MADPHVIFLSPEVNPEAKPGEKRWERKGLTGRLAVLPDGERAAVVCGNDVKIVDFQSGASLLALSGHVGDVEVIACSPDGQFLVSGDEDGQVRLWDLPSGECLKTLNAHRIGVTSAAFSPDGQRFATGGWDRFIRIWNVSRNRCVRKLKMEDPGIAWSLDFSPDGQFLASSGREGICVREVRTGTCVLTIPCEQAFSVHYSSDGRFLTAGCSDHAIRIWSASTGRCLKKLKGHSESVISVLFSSGARFLVSAGRDGTIRLWDAASRA